jgi:hypothetical protein
MAAIRCKGLCFFIQIQSRLDLDWEAWQCNNPFTNICNYYYVTASHSLDRIQTHGGAHRFTTSSTVSMQVCRICDIFKECHRLDITHENSLQVVVKLQCVRLSEVLCNPPTLSNILW